MSKTGYIFEGDPRIVMTESGADLEYVGGQPVMDRGIENAAIISLFTQKGWVGNKFLKAKHEAIGSDFEKICMNKSTTISGMESKASAARAALNWMILSRLAGKIETSWKNPQGDVFILVPRIHPPGGGSIETLILTKNGPNWINQKDDPASGRLI